MRIMTTVSRSKSAQRRRLDLSALAAFRAFSQWKRVKHLTLRSSDWGRGEDALSDYDRAASLLGAAETLRALPHIETLRLLGCQVVEQIVEVIKSSYWMPYVG